MNDKKDNFVKVSIYGQDYPVKAQADPTYITSVANFVNEKMEEVEKSLAKSQSGLRIAILAAMNITDELFNCNKEKEEVIRNLSEKVKFLIDEIDEKVQE